MPAISLRERDQQRVDAERNDIRDEPFRRAPPAPGASGSSIAGLTDVVLVGLANGQVLTFNSTSGKWNNAAPAAGGSGIVRMVQTKAVNFAAGAAANTDYVYPCTGTITATMPTAVGNTDRYTIKNSGVGIVSVASTAAQTFDGTASPITLSPGQSLDFVSDGANWSIL